MRTLNRRVRRGSARHRRPAAWGATAVMAATLPLAGCQRIETGRPLPAGTHATSSTSTLSSAPANGSTPSAQEIWNKAQDRIGTYRSLKLEAADRMTDPGATGTITGDVDTDPSEIMYSSSETGAFTIRHIGDAIYLKGDRTYWEMIAEDGDGPSEDEISRLIGTWVKMPASAMDAEDLDDLAVKDVLEELRDDSDPKWRTLAASGATVTRETVQGHPAYRITGANMTTAVWVSDDGRYDLLQLTDADPGADGLGRATFSLWNATPAIVAPSHPLDVSDGLDAPTRQTT